MLSLQIRAEPLVDVSSRNDDIRYECPSRVEITQGTWNGYHSRAGSVNHVPYRIINAYGINCNSWTFFTLPSVMPMLVHL